MTIVTRKFTQVDPRLGGDKPQPEGEIADFFHHHVFVILGEPGLGKTTSFEAAAKSEPDANYIRIGEFISAPDLEHWNGKTLYLDGLDEHRGRAEGIDVLDVIVARLRTLDCPKVRVSCRTAEWHGGKDLNALQAVSNETSVVLLELQPLTQQQILSLVSNADDFVAGAQANGLDEFLNNPQDFELLHEFYIERTRWPRNRMELMEGACKVLLKELNKARYEAIDDWVSDRNLDKASDYLASILLMSNVSGIAVDRTNTSKAFPSIHAFHGDLYALKAATGRRVFKQAGEKRIEPKHRKIAEFMAARYLASRVREGLSLRRVMALMTGIDGGTPADLRGVYAWLVTFLSGMVEGVLKHDPYGAVIYGDARSWTPRTKLSALHALEQLSKKDPWFRGQDWSRAELGGLSDASLVEDFCRILKEDNSGTHIVGAVLDMIAGGSELAEMGDPLLEFIRNPEVPDFLKDDAVDAFSVACPKRTDDLVAILEDVKSGEISDNDQYLRGALLKNLYPKIVTPETVADYLVKPSGGTIGWYHMFVRHNIWESAGKDTLRDIFNGVSNRDHELEQGDEYDQSSFIGRLIWGLLREAGEEAGIEEILSWLELGLGAHESSRIRSDEANDIRSYLSEHDQVYFDLFMQFAQDRWEDGQSWHQIWWRFRELAAHAAPPESFPIRLVEILKTDIDQDLAEALFELACVLVMNSEPGLSPLSLEDLWAIQEDDGRYSEPYERASKCVVEDWRQESAIRELESLRERGARQAKNIEELAEHKAAIEAGDALGVLDHYARVWFGLFVDVDGDASPLERLIQELGEELANNVVTGFRNAIRSPHFNTVKEIAELDAQGRSYYRGYLMLAVLDLLAADGKEAFMALPEDKLRIGVAYHLTNAVDRNADWPQWLREDRSDLFASVLGEIWGVQIALGGDRVNSLYEFNKDDPLLPIAKEIVPDTLRAFPKSQSGVLKFLLLIAVRHHSKEILLPLVAAALALRFRQSGQRAMWTAIGFVLAPDDYLAKLRHQLKQDEQNKWAVLPILLAGMERADHQSSVEFKTHTIRLLGAHFRNVGFDTRGGARWVSDQDEPTAANSIRHLIQSFSSDPSADASNSLAELIKDVNLTQWKTDILFATANQLRTAREANFTYPDVSQVVSTLADAEPANVADLKALVVDALREVADEIRHGNTDGYKSFWNIGKHGKVTKVHVDENTARDRLLELLRPKLRHLDMAAEPEVRYAEEKRADIAIYCRGMKLPIEIKRDDHPKIWTAAENQLEGQYTRDPSAEGNGIYLAFWFDGEMKAKPPKGVSKPKTAEELEDALKFTIPESSEGLIDVIVIDVSVPSGKAAK